MLCTYGTLADGKTGECMGLMFDQYLGDRFLLFYFTAIVRVSAFGLQLSWESSDNEVLACLTSPRASKIWTPLRRSSQLHHSHKTSSEPGRDLPLHPNRSSVVLVSLPPMQIAALEGSRNPSDVPIPAMPLCSN